ncbi:MAG: type II secretion system GspH family protein [Lachnospiraceae bacterium]|nr:type II secretion system GspH family protein [Lachnospiraceae bacterium]
MKTIRKNRRNRISSDGGFTLLELVVVMAIIIVTLSFFIMGMRLIFTTPSRQCARELKAALEKIRIDTMGRNAAGLKIYKGEKGIYIEELVASEDKKIAGNPEKRIGNHRVSVCYKTGSAAEQKDLDENGVILSFKRETGGLYGEGEHYALNGNPVTDVKYFWVASGGSVWRVSVGKLTGIVDLKRVDSIGDESD